MNNFIVDKYFNFLITEFNFKGPITYNFYREIHTDYIKDNIVVKIVYDGDYWCDLIKIKGGSKDILFREKRIVDIDRKKLIHYKISDLDINRNLYHCIFNDNSNSNYPEKKLWYYSTLLKKNSEVLNGDFRKFSFWFLFFNRIIYKFKCAKQIYAF